MVLRIVLLLALPALLLTHAFGQVEGARQVKSVSVYERKRLDMLTCYDRNGNESFLFWDGETTAARSMEYDSLGQLVKWTNAHCNTGCSEVTYEYGPGIKRTWELEWPNADSTTFPREEAFAKVLRKVQDSRKLKALPEMVALHKLNPRLKKEEYLNTLGHVVRMVDYDPDGRVSTTTIRHDDRGRPLEEFTYATDGDTARKEYHYGYNCEEPIEVHEESSGFHWAYGRRTVYQVDSYRTCDENGRVIHFVRLGRFEDRIDSTVTVYRYSMEGKLIMRLNGRYDPMIPEASWDYDEHGNELKFVAYSGGGPIHLTRLYTYNERGDRIEEVVTEFEQTKVLRYRYKYW